jgi:hypothetical protein
MATVAVVEPDTQPTGVSLRISDSLRLCGVKPTAKSHAAELLHAVDS